MLFVNVLLKLKSMGTYCIAQGTLPSALCNQNGREVQKGGDICMCMADSFC